jgi:hypothetical protein
MGLGSFASRLLAWGLGSWLEVEIEIPIQAPTVVGGGGGRTYLFIPRTIRFNVGFRGTVHESHFSVPEVGKVLAKHIPMLVKAKVKKDGLS